MQRVLSTVTLLGLLVATAAAFAITEHLKLIKSPIYATKVTRIFSPVCGCAESKATVSVSLRHPYRVTVVIESAGQQPVATLASDRPEQKGRISFSWDGRTDAGARAPDGRYRPEIELVNGRRTFLLPNRIMLDTVPPEVRSASDSRGLLSPGGSHTVAIHYVLSEPGHALVYLGKRLVVRGRTSQAHGPHAVVKWAGKLGGKLVPAGRDVLRIGAVDVAGNTTPKPAWKSVTVVVRYVALARKVIHVRAGARFSIAVETSAPRYAWRLAGRHGTGHKPVLDLSAPAQRGRYRLVVSEHGHSASALVIVSAKG